MLITRFLA